MEQGRRPRIGILVTVGAVVLLVGGQGVASAAERSASLDGPIDTITDTLEDPVGTITDTVEDTVDTVDDIVGDPIGTVTGSVDRATGAIGRALGGTTDPILGGAGSVSSGGDGSVDGTAGIGADTVASGTATSSATSSAPRAHEVSSGPRAAAKSPSDLDEVAGGGNDVVEGPGGAVCDGTAGTVCLGLVGGLGPIGALYRAASDVVDAFVDTLARTGIDLFGASGAFVALTLIGIALISRRRTQRPDRSGQSIVGA
jgi:hypothetical protein